MQAVTGWLVNRLTVTPSIALIGLPHQMHCGSGMLILPGVFYAAVCRAKSAEFIAEVAP